MLQIANCGLRGLRLASLLLRDALFTSRINSKDTVENPQFATRNLQFAIRNPQFTIRESAL